MAERGVTLKRTGEILGGDKPLAVRTISAYIARGDLEAYGSLKGRRVTMRSIIAYQEGRRGEWQTRCDAVLFRLSRLILPRRAELTALCYELSWVGENAQSALKLRDLGGGVRGLAVGFGLACIGVQPAESKLALAGDGRADKQQMIAAARQVFGVALNEHEADAAAHALSGEILLRTRKLIARAG